MRWLWTGLATVLLCLQGAAAQPGTLPVYIEDNHAGSFGWFARTVDLESPHLLVLVDAHSDANAVGHSDGVRDGLRRVASESQREERITRWRADGRIQAFNWIEPLMPAPVERVAWVAGWELSADAKNSLRKEAGESVDGRLEFEARASDEMSTRWQVLDAAEFEYWQPENLPVLATIDLDFFAGMSSEEAANRFHQIWKHVLALPRLQAVSFAVSRPWLNSDAEAFRLLALALDEVRLVRGARVEFEPFNEQAPDDSLRAEALRKSGGKVPHLEIDQVPRELQEFFTRHASLFRVRKNRERWASLVSEWRDAAEVWEIHPDSMQCSTDGIWRICSEDTAPALRVWSSTASGTPTRVRWWALVPATTRYNLLPGLDLGKEWTQEAGEFVREERRLLCETTDGALAPSTWRTQLDPATHWGKIRLEAEIQTEHGWSRTAPCDIRVTSGDGFHAGLSEQFGSPYVFGIGFAQQGELEGADTGWGNDCANFLIAAWRRTGCALPWSNPAQLRARLQTIAQDVDLPKRVPISEADVQRGVAIDFGRHMAALWEDREPRGVLDPRDIVAHHLGGVPELTTLGTLASTRPHFAVHVLPAEAACEVVIGGDVVLAGVEREAVDQMKVSAGKADLLVVNLEGVPGTAAGSLRKPYKFVFPRERLRWLKDAGVDAVGTANNHFGDAGLDGIRKALRAGTTSGIPIFGAGENTSAAVRPWLTERNGVRFAFFSVSCVEAASAGAQCPGVATLPEHAEEFGRALSRAKSDGCTVIVLAHWGLEYTETVEREQRYWARWLIDHGADVVAGSHPHVVQSLDFYRGKAIAYSLGNAVFPEALGRLGAGAWLHLGLDTNGSVLSTELKLPKKPREGTLPLP